MKIKRLPLEERKWRLNNGRAAHPEYNACIIRSLAHTLLADLFIENPAALQKIATRMGFTEKEAGYLTYLEAAKIISCLRDSEPYCADTAIELMASPFMAFIERRWRDVQDPESTGGAENTA